MNMIEAKNIINNDDGFISTLEMINIVSAFRAGLRAIGPDLKEVPNYSVGEVFALVGADWALDVFTKKLMFELADEK